MKKQFFRVKQLADQTFLKAEKSELLNSEELQIAEKKIDFLKTAITAICKRLPSSSGTQIVDAEKRTRKSAEYHLGTVLAEYGNSHKLDTILTDTDEVSLFQEMLRECAIIEMDLAREYAEHEIKVEEMVSDPLQTLLENDLPSLGRFRSRLNNYILDKDSTAKRYHSTKKETLKDDMDEADSKVEQTRDQFAIEMFSLLAKENEISMHVLQLLKLQKGYHESALKMLDQFIPDLELKILNSRVRPVFKVPLEEHLKVTGKTIALPLDLCVGVLSKIGMSEEGLFRIGGSIPRVKRLKASLDSGCFTAITPEYEDCPVLASTLKLYLRELPEPLFTYKLYPNWLRAITQSDNKPLVAIKELVARLPIENFNNLAFLMRFLAQVARRPETKMTPANLAIVFAPNLLWDDVDEHLRNLNMEECAICNQLVELIIREVDQIFPNDVIYQSVVNVSTPIRVSVPTNDNVGLAVDCSPRPNQRRKKPTAPTPPHLKVPLTSVSQMEPTTAVLQPPLAEPDGRDGATIMTGVLFRASNNEKPTIPARPKPMPRPLTLMDSTGQQNRIHNFDTLPHSKSSVDKGRGQKHQKAAESETESRMHSRTKSDGNIVDIDGSGHQQPIASRHYVNKPSLPPPPPPLPKPTVNCGAANSLEDVG